MDRARRTSHRRPALGASASPQSTSEASLELSANPPTSPVALHAAAASAGTGSGPGTGTPQTAPHGRRPRKPFQHAFTFSTPGPNRHPNARKRSNTMDNYRDEDDEGAPRKGGHSLRKRARVDYTFEHIDDEVVVPNSTSSAARGRKRRPEAGSDMEDIYSVDSKRRGASMGADTPSSRRRNPSRKSVETKAYREAAVDDDDKDVQDTIEVGVSYSDLEDDDSPSASSNNSSPQSEKAQSRHEHPDPAGVDASHHPTETLNNTSQTPSKLPTRVSIEDVAPEPPQSSSPSVAKAQPLIEQPRDSHASPPPPAAPTPTPEKEPEPTSAPLPAPSLVPSPAPSPVPSPIPSPAPEVFPSTNGHTHIQETSRSIPEVRINGVHKSSPPRDVTPEETATVIKKEVDEEVTQTPEHQHDQEPSSHDQDQKTDNESIEESKEETEMGDSNPPLDEPIREKDQAEPSAPTTLPSASPSPDIRKPSEPPHTDEQTAEEPRIATHVEPTALASPPPTEAQPEPVLDASTTDAKPNEVQEISPPPAELKKASSPRPTDDIPEPPGQTSSLQRLPSPQKTTESKPVAATAKPQPTPIGRWSYLTPYIEGEHVSYPEKKTRSDEEGTADDQTPEEKEADKDATELEPMVDDNDDGTEAATKEAPTSALNTPTRGSPALDSGDLTAFNSPAPATEDADEADVSEAQDVSESKRYYKYRKLRDADEYISAIENYEDMSTADLHEILEAINVSLAQWQTEWSDLGKIVDDYENSLRRRAADAKYEQRTRNLQQHGLNYEEPDFAVKGYRSREKESMNETRYLQSQDRIMAATYGFEYDPHPSKIGRQNPETQQVGIMTRGRSLRNQPRQTAKATETEEVTGKRQRKPVQHFDPATQDVSRSSTPVPTRGRRRRNGNGDNDDTQASASVSFNADIPSDGEGPGPKTRRRRGARGKTSIPSIVEDLAPSQDQDDDNVQEEPVKTSRRGRGKPAPRYEEIMPQDDIEEEPSPELKQPRRHLLTLKIPKGKNFSEPSSAITDNGDSRPSTADSDSTSHTAESSYSFRPKRQKRFRDDPDEIDEAGQAPPKKRGKRTSGAGATAAEDAVPSVAWWPEQQHQQQQQPQEQQQQQQVQPAQSNRKVQKIKVVRSVPESRNGTPASQTNTAEDAEGQPKDYKSMTKSEKMSASMKNRWANGNMAGAVEKRKATLAAKKAAQAAADQKLGALAPKLKGKGAAAKKEALDHQQLHQQQFQQQFQHQPPPFQGQQQHLPPPPPPPPPPPHHHHHHHHQGPNPNFIPGIHGMGYQYHM